MRFGDRFGVVSRLGLVAAGALLALSVSGATDATSAGKSVPFTRVNTLGVGGYAVNGMTRTADGTLHLIYQTTTGSSFSPTGLGTTSISTAGSVGTETAALKGWNTSIPGLVGSPERRPRGGLRRDLAANQIRSAGSGPSPRPTAAQPGPCPPWSAPKNPTRRTPTVPT